MGKLAKVPAYNSRKQIMSLSGAFRVPLFLLLLSGVTFASDWRQPESQLSAKIAAVTGPGVIALELTNRSSVSSADADQIRRDLTSLLATAGVRVWQPDQASAIVKLTLSENLQQYVWVAQIQQAANQQNVVIVSMPRPESAVTAQNAPPLILHSSPLISQPGPILDVAVLDGSPRRMLILGTGSVTINEFKDGPFVSGQLAINSPVPLPRDLRGRIFLRKDHLFDVYLPGLFCRSTNSSPLSIACNRSDDPWPVETEEQALSAFFSPTRNFFTGALAPGIGKQKSAPPFYSAAAVSKPNYTLWILSGTDGQIYLLDGINQQIAGKTRWGSDIAGIRASCRPGWQVITTSTEDDGHDSLQAFEFPDREPLAISQKLEVNGTITALWTAQDGNSATAVYRNSSTGDYEAVQLTLTCQ
jgi:hypothetical protein